MNYEDEYDVTDEVEDEVEEESVTFADGQAVWFVGVYDVSRQYGGPEEGGWWFDAGTLIRTFVCKSEDEARDLRDNLRESGEWRETGKRYSVLGGDDYDVMYNKTMPPRYFPEEYPHYE